MSMSNKIRTITMTNRPPVKIREDQWPVIAHGRYFDSDSPRESDAMETCQADIRVRQHADGRAIVYGVYDYDTAFPGRRSFIARAGVLLDAGADIVQAIREVGGELAEAARQAGRHEFVAHIAEAVRDCIAALPAQELT